MNINKAEFLELVKAESVARKSTAVPTEREKLRKQLNRDVKKFLKSGGQVEQLPGTEFKPRPQRSTVESSENGYISQYQKTRLANWCNSGGHSNPRRNILSELTGISLQRIRHTTVMGHSNRLTRGEYKKICAVISKAEELQKLRDDEVLKRKVLKEKTIQKIRYQKRKAA